jgi:hypothetical protein
VRLAGGGKLSRRGTVAVVTPGAKNTAAPGHLFFITDQISEKKLLVDTGSAYSILPHKSNSAPFGPRPTARRYAAGAAAAALCA